MTIDELVAHHSNNETFKLNILASKEKKKMPKIMQELAEKYKK